MITDPVNEKAEPHGGTTHRVLRGAISAAIWVCDLELGHQRDTEHPEGFSEDHGLRLSVTLALPPSGAALHRKEVTRGDAHGAHRSRPR